MPALSFSEVETAKVLPDVKVASTGGNSADYEVNKSVEKKGNNLKNLFQKKQRKPSAQNLKKILP